MVIGVLQVELAVPWAESLKDKRRVVRSIKDRLHREHQASVAEVAALGVMTVARLGIAVVAIDGERAGKVLDAISEKLRGVRDAEFVAATRQILHGSQIELVGEDEPEAVAADDADLTDAMLARAAEALGSDGDDGDGDSDGAEEGQTR